MELKILNDLYTDENTYLLFSGNDVLLIDPGTRTEDILKMTEGKKIKYILLTHCHYDHITAVPELSESFGAQIYCTGECAANVGNSGINLTEAALGKSICIDNISGILTEEKGFDFNGEHIDVIKTPGHTSCSTCFLWENKLFSGDTLFQRSVGRWDLPTGSKDILEKSIREKLYTLDDNTEVYPGHGKPTSIGYEKKFNMCIR
ncbi:MAG: MBL fold metallo-hydrolase [Clostridia bacterium]|nr:MBL fold metallo-hydrolase [Clostridia bacterium]